RLIWYNDDEEERVIYLRHEDLLQLHDILSHNSTDKIELEDGVSSILVNSDTTEFFMANMKSLEIETKMLKEKIMEFLTKNPDA
ncbi:MAG: nitroreductase family protein, partial [Nitrosopumilaceae archaeon]